MVFSIASGSPEALIEVVATIDPPLIISSSPFLLLSMALSAVKTPGPCLFKIGLNSGWWMRTPDREPLPLELKAPLAFDLVTES